MALNNSAESTIYQQMLAYRGFPENLFQVSESRRNELAFAIQARGQ
jgi:hypothetical protein